MSTGRMRISSNDGAVVFHDERRKGTRPGQLVRRPCPTAQSGCFGTPDRLFQVEMTHALTYPGQWVLPPDGPWKDIAVVAKADEEKDWVRHSREGDFRAYRRLVERYEVRIYRLVARILGQGHGNIEDVVQEVFVKAYFSLRKFRGDASFGTWIYRIAVNRARDEIRKNPGTVSLDEVLTRESAMPLRHSAFGDDSSEDESETETSESLGKLVGDVMAALPEKLRIVATLKDMEGLSFREVSRILDISVGTVKSRHSRARERLRELLRPYAGELSRQASHEL